jgi:hypothetical protein
MYYTYNIKNMYTKKNSIVITSIILFILAVNNVFSWQVSLEKNLNLNHWVELLELNSVTINDIRFKNFENQRRLNNLKDTDKIIKKLISMQYESWKIGFYEMSWISVNYSNFAYHANKYFEYLKIQEQRPYLWEIDYAISKNYRNMRESYKKVVQLID